MIDLEILWKEKEEIDNPQIIPIEDEDFQGATTMEDYEKANPGKVGGEVLISVKL